MTDIMDLITMLTANSPGAPLHSSDRFGSLLSSPWGDTQNLVGMHGINPGRGRLDYFQSLLPQRQRQGRVIPHQLTSQFVGLLNQIRNTKQAALNPNLDPAAIGAFASRASPSSFHEGLPTEFHEGLPSQKGSYY
jgi:hypothetical protein